MIDRILTSCLAVCLTMATAYPKGPPLQQPRASVVAADVLVSAKANPNPQAKDQAAPAVQKKDAPKEKDIANEKDKKTAEEDAKRIKAWVDAKLKVAEAAKQAKADAKNNAIQANRNKAQRNQIISRLRPATDLELAFLRRCSQPTDEQRMVIAIDVTDMLEKLADEGNSAISQRGAFVQINGKVVENQDSQLGPQVRLRNKIRAIAKKQLTEEQFAAYTKEFDLRSEADKQRLVDQILMRIDQFILLEEEQYDVIEKVLTNKIENVSSMRFNFQPYVLPSIPDDWIVPHLSESQKKIWTLANKQTSYSSLQSSNTFFKEKFWEPPAEAVDDEAKQAAGDIVDGQPQEKK
ncbi:hypothetical protein FF011L_52520 [Roseimaritima multifibrata]|uniref:Uncharacterized protein n=1 Tax=Roseimaritima multifibrata TaxID=1930274 RepID=A0A517MNI9_9BACT|nr:hypothetical protein [Roseimaritima multifibrata]QDS96441.1 hypothetical protein FF011L_52520 [Roseimaritima multifibrata]